MPAMPSDEYLDNYFSKKSALYGSDSGSYVTFSPREYLRLTLDYNKIPPSEFAKELNYTPRQTAELFSDENTYQQLPDDVVNAITAASQIAPYNDPAFWQEAEYHLQSIKEIPPLSFAKTQEKAPAQESMVTRTVQRAHQPLIKNALATAAREGLSGEKALAEYVVNYIPWVHTEHSPHQYTVCSADLTLDQRLVMMAFQEMGELLSKGKSQKKHYFPRAALEAAIAEVRGDRLIPVTERPLADHQGHTPLTAHIHHMDVDLSQDPHITLMNKALSIAANSGYSVQNTHTRGDLRAEWENVYQCLSNRSYAPLVDYAVRTLPWEPTHTAHTTTAIKLSAGNLTDDQRTVLDALVRNNLLYHPSDKEHAGDYLPRPPLEKVIFLTRVAKPTMSPEEALATRWCKHRGYKSLEEYATFEMPWKNTPNHPGKQHLTFNKLNVNQMLVLECLERKGKVVATNAQQEFYVASENFQEEMQQIVHNNFVDNIHGQGVPRR